MWASPWGRLAFLQKDGGILGLITTHPLLKLFTFIPHAKYTHPPTHPSLIPLPHLAWGSEAYHRHKVQVWMKLEFKETATKHSAHWEGGCMCSPFNLGTGTSGDYADKWQMAKWRCAGFQACALKDWCFLLSVSWNTCSGPWAAMKSNYPETILLERPW